jgi:hypothetical protein
MKIFMKARASHNIGEGTRTVIDTLAEIETKVVYRFLNTTNWVLQE